MGAHLSSLHHAADANRASFVGSGLMVQQTTGGQIVERDPMDWDTGGVASSGTSDKPARWG